MFWNRFVDYCEAVGKAPNVVASEIGIKSSGTVTGWKNGAMPRNSVLAKLAEYFGVSIRDFIGEETEKPILVFEDGQSGEALEQEFMRWFRVQPPERQKDVLFELAKAVSKHDE